jgi:hypothetical protein
MPDILLPAGPYSLWRDDLGQLWRVAADGQSRVAISDQVAWLDAISLQRRGLFHDIIDGSGTVLGSWLDSVPVAS